MEWTSHTGGQCNSIFPLGSSETVFLYEKKQNHCRWKHRFIYLQICVLQRNVHRCQDKRLTAAALNGANWALFPRIIFIVCPGLEKAVQDLKAKLELQSLWCEDYCETRRGCYTHSLIYWLISPARCSAFRFFTAGARHLCAGHQLFLQIKVGGTARLTRVLFCSWGFQCVLRGWNLSLLFPAAHPAVFLATTVCKD